MVLVLEGSIGRMQAQTHADQAHYVSIQRAVLRKGAPPKARTWVFSEDLGSAWLVWQFLLLDCGLREPLAGQTSYLYECVFFVKGSVVKNPMVKRVSDL